MNVLHVIPGLAIRSGGDRRACAELCESLAKLGVDVTLVYLREDGWEEFQPEGVRLCRCEPSSGLLGPWFSYSVQLREALKKLICQCDLVHTHEIWRYPGLAAARVAMRASIPYIVQPHGSLHPWKLNHKGLKKSVYGFLFERWVLRHARYIHAESEMDRQHISHFVPSANVFVLPSGAYPEKLAAPTRLLNAAERWPLLEGQRIILYLGRLDVNKGVDLLLRAFQQAASQVPGWKLLLVGPDFGEMRASMERLASMIGIADRVVWAGLVSEEEKRLALQSCDFCVMPSRAENFGISILEALLCGRPVITTTETPWGKLQEIGAGEIVPPKVESLTGALAKWISLSKTELDEIGRKGYQFASNEFNWAKLAGRCKEIYEEVLSESS